MTPISNVGQSQVRSAILGMFIAACMVLAGCGSRSEPATRAISVHVIAVQPDAEPGRVSLSGTVVPRVQSQLAFRVPGHILRRVADTGASVTKGDVLAQLDETPFRLVIDEASAELAQAQATLARVRRDVERNRGLARTGAIAGADFDALETLHTSAQAQVHAAQSRLNRARNDLAYATLKAPADGNVAEVQAEAGQVVAAGTPVLRLAVNAQIEIQVDVPESQIGRIAVGTPVKAHLSSLSGSELAGTVREVAAVADPGTRTYRVRVALPELPAAVRMGMTATVHLAAARQDGHVRLPIAALYQQGEQPAVWVLPDGEQQLALRPISLAAMGTDTITVADGLAPGERVVVAGVHRLDAGMTVQAWDGRLP